MPKRSVRIRVDSGFNDILQQLRRDNEDFIRRLESTKRKKRPRVDTVVLTQILAEEATKGDVDIFKKIRRR